MSIFNITSVEQGLVYIAVLSATAVILVICDHCFSKFSKWRKQ